MNEVMESFKRVHSSGLAERFYEIFLKTDPRIIALFRKTDFKRQSELLMHGILVLLEYAEGKAVGELGIRRLGEMHDPKGLNVTSDMYPIWVNCLIKTLAEKDPQFTPELEGKWRVALQKGLNIMIEMS